MRPPTIAERRFAEARDKLCGLIAQEIFNFIYQTNLWSSSEALSGVGSELDATANIRSQLPPVLKDMGVSTFLDLPCGDFSWMSTVQLPIQHYIGGDIVPAVIERNSNVFRQSHPFAEFRVLDLANDPLPDADALFCRDCLVHLSYATIFESFCNIARSCIRYVIMTTFLGNGKCDIEIGNWRPINFQQHPFSLPEPSIVIIEGCTEENGAYADKALGVWPVDALR
jgi:SAM-dependent methyltransferase